MALKSGLEVASDLSLVVNRHLWRLKKLELIALTQLYALLISEFRIRFELQLWDLLLALFHLDNPTLLSRGQKFAIVRLMALLDVLGSDLRPKV